MRITFQVKHFVDILKQMPNTNQAILQVAQPNDCYLGDPQYMADEIGVESGGGICASSKGLHLYGYIEELAKLRVGKKND